MEVLTLYRYVLCVLLCAVYCKSQETALDVELDVELDDPVVIDRVYPIYYPLNIICKGAAQSGDVLHIWPLNRVKLGPGPTGFPKESVIVESNNQLVTMSGYRFRFESTMSFFAYVKSNKPRTIMRYFFQVASTIEKVAPIYPGISIDILDANTIVIVFKNRIKVPCILNSDWNHIGFTYDGKMLRVWVNEQVVLVKNVTDKYNVLSIVTISHRIFFCEEGPIPYIKRSHSIACITFDEKVYERDDVRNLNAKCGTPTSALYAFYPLERKFGGREFLNRREKIDLRNIIWADGVTGYRSESVILTRSYPSMQLHNTEFHFPESMSLFIHIKTDYELRIAYTDLVQPDIEQQLSDKTSIDLGLTISIHNDIAVYVGGLLFKTNFYEAPIRPRWKHVGLMYDSESQRISIWLNKKKVLDEYLEYGLLEKATNKNYINFYRKRTNLPQTVYPNPQYEVANMACVTFHNETLGKDTIDYLDLACGTEYGWDFTLSKVICEKLENCLCSNEEVCDVGFISCSLESCDGGCDGAHCCCAQPVDTLPCGDPAECHCSLDNECEVGYISCSSESCGGCDGNCCCIQPVDPDTVAPCTDPAKCHCYVDNCFDVGYDYCVQGTCSGCEAEHCCCCEQKIDQDVCVDKPCHCIDEGMQCSDSGLEYCSPSRCQGVCGALRCCCQKEELCPAWSECHCMTQPCSEVDELHDCDRCCGDCAFGHCCCCEKEWPVCPRRAECHCMERACDELSGLGFCDPSRCNLTYLPSSIMLTHTRFANYFCPPDQCCCKLG